MDCPKCDGPCFRDDVDVGVGVIYGPWGCSCCGWSEDPRYDSSEGVSPAQQEAGPERYVDAQGNSYCVERIVERCAHFGIPEDMVREAFDQTKDGTTKDGTTKDGTTKDGTTKDGTTKDGTTKDGTTKDGNPGME
jgi:hypothetical protein